MREGRVIRIEIDSSFAKTEQIYDHSKAETPYSGQRRHGILGDNITTTHQNYHQKKEWHRGITRYPIRSGDIWILMPEHY